MESVYSRMESVSWAAAAKFSAWLIVLISICEAKTDLDSNMKLIIVSIGEPH